MLKKRLEQEIYRTSKKHSLLKHQNSVSIDTGKLNKQAMLKKMTKYEEFTRKIMATEELKNTNTIHKEFQSLLDQDFKDRKLKKRNYQSYSIRNYKKLYRS